MLFARPHFGLECCNFNAASEPIRGRLTNYPLKPIIQRAGAVLQPAQGVFVLADAGD
jgi:hypothetical protein